MLKDLESDLSYYKLKYIVEEMDVEIKKLIAEKQSDELIQDLNKQIQKLNAYLQQLRIFVKEHIVYDSLVLKEETREEKLAELKRKNDEAGYFIDPLPPAFEYKLDGETKTYQDPYYFAYYQFCMAQVNDISDMDEVYKKVWC